jgi:hypothetical protein
VDDLGDGFQDFLVHLAAIFIRHFVNEVLGKLWNSKGDSFIQFVYVSKIDRHLFNSKVDGIQNLLDMFRFRIKPEFGLRVGGDS